MSVEKAKAVQAKRDKEKDEGKGVVVVTEAPDILKWIDSGECMIEDRHSLTTNATEGNWVTYVPWQAQRDYLTTRKKYRKTISLKARQLGFSWTDEFEDVHLTQFYAGTAVLIVSKDEDSAVEQIRRMRGIIKRLKNPAAREVGRENLTQIRLSNGSVIKAFANTANAGTSFTATKVVIEEADKVRFGDKLLQSLKPLIADGNMLFSILFTVQGGDGLGRKLWEIAHDGEHDPLRLHRIFVPWWARPGRDAEWYEREKSEALSEVFFRQDYPSTPEEALNFTDGDLRLLKFIEDWDRVQLVEPITPRSVVVALDAGIKNDSFGMLSMGWHPTQKRPLVADVKEWKAEKNERGDTEIDLAEVEEFVLSYLSSKRIKSVVFDPYQLASFGQKLAKRHDAKEFSQRTRRGDADTLLLKTIRTGGILHNGDLALREHVDNADIEQETGERRIRLAKRRRSLKIDLAVTLSMAHHELTTTHPFKQGVDGPSMRIATAEQVRAALLQQQQRQNNFAKNPFLGRPKMIEDRYNGRRS